MQVAICITRSVVVDDDIDSLDIYATAKDVSGDKDTLLEVLELRITCDTGIKLNEGTRQTVHKMSYRSSWLRLEWTVMHGNEHSRRSLSSSTARATDLTKMTTWSYGSDDHW